MQDYAMYEGTDLAKEVQKRGTDAWDLRDNTVWVEIKPIID